MTTSNEVWSILRIIQWSEGFLASKGIESPRFEVEVLLAEALRVKRLDLYLQFERVLGKEELAVFKGMLLRRAKHEPSAYILGRREFYGMEFTVNRDVLVPRPETEHLVDVTIGGLKGMDSPVIVEVGTGSGNICCAIAGKMPSARIYATEMSPTAAAVARGNVTAHKLDSRVTVINGDLFEPVPVRLKDKVSAVVSNPPYIGESERATIPADVLEYEPDGALFAGPDGLDVIRRLVVEARKWLHKGGMLAFEIGYRQAEAATDLLDKAGYRSVEVTQDYAGNDRVMSARL